MKKIATKIHVDVEKKIISWTDRLNGERYHTDLVVVGTSAKPLMAKFGNSARARSLANELKEYLTAERESSGYLSYEEILLEKEGAAAVERGRAAVQASLDQQSPVLDAAMKTLYTDWANSLQVNPWQDIKNLVDAVNEGFVSREKAAELMGIDLKEVDAQNKRDRELMQATCDAHPLRKDQIRRLHEQTEDPEYTQEEIDQAIAEALGENPFISADDVEKAKVSVALTADANEWGELCRSNPSAALMQEYGRSINIAKHMYEHGDADLYRRAAIDRVVARKRLFDHIESMKVQA